MLIISLLISYQNSFVPADDEGLAAHLFQILMPTQAVIILYFTFKYLPQKPKQTLEILALQVACAAAVCAPVFIFHL